MAYLKIDRVENLCHRKPPGRGSGRHRPDHRTGRVRLDYRAFGLRHVHAPEPDRRTDAGHDGAIKLDGYEANAPGPDRAVVFQNHSLLPWLSVYDNVRLAVDKVFAGKRSRAEWRAWIMHNLDPVQMRHAADKRSGEISGGMRQRVGIALALAMEPKVLLPNEPFGAWMR